VLLWSDADRTAAGLSRFGPRAEDGCRAHLTFLRRCIEMVRQWFLSPPMTHRQLRDQYAGTADAEAFERLWTRSHWDVLGDYFNDEKVKCALARADDSGVPTAVGSLLAEVVENASTGAGVENKSGFVHGGMGAISGALADAVRRFGAEILARSPVE